jgi:hypothetical protein
VYAVLGLGAGIEGGRVNVGNRTIFTLWHQGYNGAPAVVRASLESWRRLNPDWRVVALDQNSVHDWIALNDIVDLERSDLPVQKISAIARLCLLQSYGGVWTDATVFCLCPLDEWLGDYHSIGFTAFRNPGPDRLMSNWFIAAEKGNAILRALHDTFLGFINGHIFPHQGTKLGRANLARVKPIARTDVKSTLAWFEPGFVESVGAYPYFIFHYAFNKVILSNPALRAMWESVPALDSAPPHRLQRLAKTEGGLALALAGIEGDDWLLQKLDWRIDESDRYWSAVLGRLTDHVAGAGTSRAVPA